MNKYYYAAMFAGVSVLALTSPALAQPAPTNSSAAAQAEEDTGEDDAIIVTGTLIRGVAPAGGNVIGLNTADVAATNATTTAQVLAAIPQVGDFNGLPRVVGVGPQQASNRPGVRGLTSGTSGGSPTLILMDGHRLPGAGVIQTVADPDVIPPGAIQRVEVVTDGGSSIYGADAVGGVINFITRSDFDGVELNWREGFGDSYRSTDAYLTVGEDWGSGSAYITYNYAYNDEVLGADRDYVRNIIYNPSDPLRGLPANRNCAPGSVTAGGVDYNIVNGVPGTTPATPASVRCDLSLDSAIYPEERRDSFLGGISQDLTDSLTFNVRGWYTNRLTKNQSAAPGSSRVITAANAFFDPVGAETQQTVYYSFEGVPGLETTARAELETWGVSPSLTWDAGADWQVRAFANYGHSVTTTSAGGIDNVVVTNNANNINFYNLSATNPALLDQILNGNTQSGRGQDEILNGRIVADGPTIRLPGGDVRVAVGVEYLEEQYEGFNSQLATNPRFSDERESSAVFGEVQIPIFSAENSIPLVHALSVSLSARRDDYSDFGETSNPRVGVTYEPVDWLTFRGNWGTSFQAPSLADTAQTGSTASSFGAGVLASSLPFTPGATDQLIAVQGAAPLVAQEAETYSIGFDVRPPGIEGLEVGATYYNIEFEGQIGSPAVFVPTFFTDPATAQFFRANGGADIPDGQIQTYLSGAGLSDAQIAQVLGAVGTNNVVTLIDFRRRNLGNTRVSGIDARLRYDFDTSFGSIFLNASGTYLLERQEDPAGTGVYGGNLAGAPGQASRWGATATVGANIGDNFRGQATVTHTDNQIVNPTATNAFQDEINPFTVVNLFFQYDVDGAGLTEDLRLSLGINNVFDEDPSRFNGTTFLSAGYVGGNLGRVFQLGLNKRF